MQIFNQKGEVRKTTVALNLAKTLNLKSCIYLLSRFRDKTS